MLPAFLPTPILPRSPSHHVKTHPHFQPPKSSTETPSPFQNLALLATAALSLNLPMKTHAHPTPSSPPPSVLLPQHSHPTSHRRSTTLHTPLRVHLRAPIATVTSAPVSITDRIAFYLGEFLTWNPAARVLALLALTLLAMYLGSFLYRFADPDSKEAQSPFWHSVRAIANPLEDDWERVSLRTTSIALAAIGMVVFAIMIGMVTESVESAVRNANGDRARVIVSNHIVVCGWSGHVGQMLKDVNRVRKGVPVVILAKAELRDEMMENMKDTLADGNGDGIRVFYRSGAPIIAEDLARVGAERASKIILINSREGGGLVGADRKVLTRAMALRHNLKGFRGDIVAEMNDVKSEALLQSILKGGGANSVEIVNSEALLSRFMAQVVRQPGLAEVVECMMRDDAMSVFHVRKVGDLAPQLVGKDMSEMTPMSVPGTVLCGVCDKDGVVNIGVGGEGVGGKLTRDTEILVLGVKGAKNRLSDPKKIKYMSGAEGSGMKVGKEQTSKGHKEGRKEAENYLFCGWRDDMIAMLGELDTMLPSGSKITILDENAPGGTKFRLNNLSVRCIQKNADSFENLQSLLSRKSKPYDHVVVLGSGWQSREEHAGSDIKQEEDTKTLTSLVYLQELLSKQKEMLEGKKNGSVNTHVTAEFLNEKVAVMVKEQANKINAILPLNLSSKIAAQTVRDNRLNSVWKELLSQQGREVYLRPYGVYAEVSSEPTTFAAISKKLAQTFGDVVIGYLDSDGRIVINPQCGDRSAERVWGKDVVLIVLSED